MEEPAPDAPSAENRSLKTAATLRALRDSLGAKLERQRRRISDLETDLTARVLHIAEELAQEQAAEWQADVALHEDHLRKVRGSLAERDAAIAKLERQLSNAELSHLRLSAELAESRSAIDSVRVQECQACGKLRGELAAAQEQATHSDTKLQDLQTKVGQLSQELAQSKAAAQALLAEQTSGESVLAETQFAVEQTQKLLDETLAELEASEERENLAAERVAELLVQIDQLAEELAEARDAESKLRAQHFADDNAMAESQLAADRDNQLLRAQLAEVAAARDDFAEQLAQVRAEVTAREELSANEHSWLEKEFEAAEQGRKQLATEFEQLLKQHKLAEQALAVAQLQNDQAVALLQKAEDRIHELTSSTEHEEALEQARRKFELALADAQKLKRDNAELQAELAQRPEKSAAESPELVSLRVERDALAARVAELEATPVQVVNENAEQRMSDLQRRFELAVEDLRHLKQENAQLQEKLSKAPQGVGLSSHGHGTAMDWQSQKARLLATLESEDAEGETAERRQERTTIEGTISITDRVVADKDREIAELRAQVVDQSFAVVEEFSAQSEMLDKDELIAAERSKLTQLQQELHEKMRTAEMEMSIQRATLARKEAEIEQKLQAAQQAAADAPVGPDGKPRRKWLSALGLRDDGEK